VDRISGMITVKSQVRILEIKRNQVLIQAIGDTSSEKIWIRKGDILHINHDLDVFPAKKMMHLS
jgi:hypothetical protein